MICYLFEFCALRARKRIDVYPLDETVWTDVHHCTCEEPALPSEVFLQHSCEPRVIVEVHASCILHRALNFLVKSTWYLSRKRDQKNFVSRSLMSCGSLIAYNAKQTFDISLKEFSLSESCILVESVVKFCGMSAVVVSSPTHARTTNLSTERESPEWVAPLDIFVIPL